MKDVWACPGSVTRILDFWSAGIKAVYKDFAITFKLSVVE